jgi:hypothetical protein
LKRRRASLISTTNEPKESLGSNLINFVDDNDEEQKNKVKDEKVHFINNEKVQV